MFLLIHFSPDIFLLNHMSDDLDILVTLFNYQSWETPFDGGTDIKNLDLTRKILEF